jgi:hypothetical protein
MENNKIHWTMRGGNKGEIHFEGFTPEEIEKMEGFLLGHYWATVEEGRLKVSFTKKELPTPADDVEMMPFWRKAENQEAAMQTVLFDVDTQIENLVSPHFLIQSLCGYGYTPESYKNNAERLESYGFECMRSRRGIDGRFWEIWYLPGLWASKGELKEYLIRNGNREGTTKDAIYWLCKTVKFGTLDVSVQRAAMCIND